MLFVDAERFELVVASCQWVLEGDVPGSLLTFADDAEVEPMVVHQALLVIAARFTLAAPTAVPCATLAFPLCLLMGRLSTCQRRRILFLLVSHVHIYVLR